MNDFIRYLLRATGTLVLVAIGLRLAAWVISPFVVPLATLFLILLVLFGALFPELFRRR